MTKKRKFGVQHAFLQGLELRMEAPWKMRQPHQVSRPNCRTLSTLFILICPALEVLSFLSLPTISKPMNEISPPVHFQAAADGQWRSGKAWI